IVAWIGSERSAWEARSSSATPATAPGTEAAASLNHVLQAVERTAASAEKASRASAIHTLPYARSSAINVPQWSATSNASPAYGQPSIVGITYKCALLEIGRNSVRPWTTPSTAACIGDMGRQARRHPGISQGSGPL